MLLQLCLILRLLIFCFHNYRYCFRISFVSCFAETINKVCSVINTLINAFRYSTFLSQWIQLWLQHFQIVSIIWSLRKKVDRCCVSHSLLVLVSFIVSLCIRKFWLSWLNKIFLCHLDLFPLRWLNGSIDFTHDLINRNLLLVSTLSL